MMTKNRLSFQLLIIGIISTAGYLLMSVISGHEKPVISFLIIYYALFTLYLGSIYLISKQLNTPKTIYILIFFGILFRLILIPTQPILDDDIYRYLWDGKLLANGINPYAHPPVSPEMAQYQGPYYELINFKDIPTIYPPLSQLIFAIAAIIRPDNYLILKLLLVLFDIGNIFLLICILIRLNINPLYSLIYAWSPLAIKEFANTGHHDTLVIFFSLLSIYFFIRSKYLLSSVGLSLAVLSKLYPVIFAPFIFRKIKWKGLGLFLVIIIIFYLPFLRNGLMIPFNGLMDYSKYWEFNSGLYALLNYGLAFLTENSRFITKMIGMMLVGIFWLYLIYKQKKFSIEQSIISMGLVLMMIYLVSPVVDPWYLCWLLPFLCIIRSKAWILFTGLVMLSYLYYIDYRDIWWIRWMEYIIFYLVLIWEIWINRYRIKDFIYRNSD